MGCWNGTCAISRLPILSGEKVKLVFLHNPHDEAVVSGKSAFCYPSDILTPAFLPISGTYDDYGTIEDIEADWNLDIIEQVLRKTFGSVISYDNAISTFKNDWDVYDIIRGVERGLLKYKGFVKGSLNEEPDWIKSNLSFVLIRDDVFNHVIELAQRIETFFGENVHVKLKSKFDDFVKAVRYVEKIEDPHEKIHRSFKIDSIFKSDGDSSFYLDYGVQYNKYLTESVNDVEKLKVLFKQWFDFECVKRYMIVCRHSWMIQSGAGSQDQDWDLHKSLAQKIIDICDDKIEWDE